MSLMYKPELGGLFVTQKLCVKSPSTTFDSNSDRSRTVFAVRSLINFMRSKCNRFSSSSSSSPALCPLNGIHSESHSTAYGVRPQRKHVQRLLWLDRTILNISWHLWNHWVTPLAIYPSNFEMVCARCTC